MTKNILMTTGDIKKDYKILGLTSNYFSSIVNKEPKTSEDVFAFVTNKLKENAEKMGGDAIIAVRFQREYVGGGYVQGSTLFAYGTVVKFL